MKKVFCGSKTRLKNTVPTRAVLPILFQFATYFYWQFYVGLL